MSGSYRCFTPGCSATFDSLDEMKWIDGAENRDGRHFCGGCASEIRARLLRTDEIQ